MKRRTVNLVNGLLILAGILATAPAQAQEEKIMTWSKGSPENGQPFDPLTITRIQLRGGNRVDTILVNKNQYGWSGGALTKALIMAPGEYIGRIAVYVDENRIHRLSFYTNKHPECGGDDSSRCIASGRPSGRFSQLGGVRPYNKDADRGSKRSNIRVISIAGRAHRSGLQQIEVKYISNYAEPKLLKKGVEAVVSWKVGPEKVKTYTSELLMKKERVLSVVQTTMNLGLSTSAEATVFGCADVSSTATFGFETTKREEQERELKTLLEKRVEVERTLRENVLWVSRARGDLYKDAQTGRTFFIPTGSIPGRQIDLGRRDEAKRLLSGYYDVSLGLAGEVERILDERLAERESEKDLYRFK